jgi:CRP/FNR family transcriptional regulator
MNGRISETLLYLDSIKESHPDIFLLLSRKDIADFAAISTESAVKLLKNFEKEGLIECRIKMSLLGTRKLLRI